MMAKPTILVALGVAIIAAIAITLFTQAPNATPKQDTREPKASPQSDLLRQLEAIENEVDADPTLGFAPTEADGSNADLLAAKARYQELARLSDVKRAAAVVDWAEDLAENEHEKAIDAFWAILGSSHTKSRSDAYSFVETFSASIALFNPDAAQDWLDALPNPFDEHAIQFAIKTWASIDPIGTISYIQSIPDPLLREIAINSLHQDQIDNIDPQFSDTFIEAFFNESSSKRLTPALSHHLARVSEAEATAWVKSFEDPYQQEAGWKALVKSLAQVDLPTAKRIAPAAPNEELQVASIIDIASIWGREQPSEALNWAIEFQNEQAINGASSNVFPNWILSNPSKAIEWLNNSALPPESRKLLEGFRDGSPSPN